MRVDRYAFRYTAHDQAIQSTAVMRAHHNKIRCPFFRQIENKYARIPDGTSFALEGFESRCDKNFPRRLHGILRALAGTVEEFLEQAGRIHLGQRRRIGRVLHNG